MQESLTTETSQVMKRVSKHAKKMAQIKSIVKHQPGEKNNNSRQLRTPSRSLMTTNNNSMAETGAGAVKSKLAGTVKAHD